jgi:hypothetical protein
MSDPISRNKFASDLAAGGAPINVHDLDPELAGALADAKVTTKDLERVAGKDAQIATEAEYKKLFDLLDRVDGDLNARTFSRTTEDGKPTVAGRALTELEQQIQKNRLAAHSQGAIHLGMRDASQKEADALKQVIPPTAGGVHQIKAYATEGKVDLDGRSYDLASDKGRAAYRDALVDGPTKMPAAQADRFMNLIEDAQPRTRDELAQLGVALFQAGKGDLPVNRLVLSGHGDGKALVDDAGNRVTHDEIRKLAKMFPEGAGKMEHIAFSSCFSGTNADDMRKTLDAFPNAKGVWSYSEFSPSAEKGAPAHLRQWAQKTDGEDPSQLDPSAGGVATWNKVDGHQNVPRLTTAECEKIADAADEQIQAYSSGKRDPARGASDWELRAAYIRVAQAVNAAGIPDDLRQRLEDQKAVMYGLRHPG